MVDFKKYEKEAESINKPINALHNKIMFITPDEILKEEVKFSELSNQLDDLDMKVVDKKAAFNSEVNSKYSEEEYAKIEDKHAETEELYYNLSKKIQILVSVLDKLYNIRMILKSPDNKKRLSKFDDIKSMELGESFQPIKLSRLKRV